MYRAIYKHVQYIFMIQYFFSLDMYRVSNVIDNYATY